MSDLNPYEEGLAFDLKAALDRIEELEAKLAKAVVALHKIAGKKDYADGPWDIARATLAELKGQNNE